MNGLTAARARLRSGALSMFRLRYATSLVGLALVFAAATGGADLANAKAPGHTYCFYGKCHRVKTLGETSSLLGRQHSLVASHYSHCSKDPYNPCGLTSSGEKFYPGRADNAASPIYPDGTTLLLWHRTSKEAAVVRVNNAGPYWGNRTLDVSYALAEKLGFRSRGVSALEVRVLKAPEAFEARYRKNRSYRRVAGPIGRFESMDGAYRVVAAMMAAEAMAGSVFAPSIGGMAADARNETDADGKLRIAVDAQVKELAGALHRGLEMRSIDVRESQIAFAAAAPVPNVDGVAVAPLRATSAEFAEDAGMQPGDATGVELNDESGAAEFHVVASLDVGGPSMTTDDALIDRSVWLPDLSARQDVLGVGGSVPMDPPPYGGRPARMPRSARGGMLG